MGVADITVGIAVAGLHYDATVAVDDSNLQEREAFRIESGGDAVAVGTVLDLDLELKGLAIVSGDLELTELVAAAEHLVTLRVDHIEQAELVVE